MRHKAFQPFSNILALKMSLILGIFLDSILVLGYISGSGIKDSINLQIAYAFSTDIVLFYLLYSFSFKIIQLDIKKELKPRYIIVGTLAIAGVCNFIVTEGSLHLFQSNVVPPNMLVVGNVMKNLIELFIVLLSTSLLHSVSERQLILLENEKLIADNIRIRYEVLKNQVDPHFLFNTLNTLNGLIGVDDDRAHEYLLNLSQVLRYAIGNKEIMHLDEELDFTESYAHLMQIRYGENIQIKYNIAEKYRNWYIMPISLQLLVENAIKHNVISNKYPLVINIETTDLDSITVSNIIQQKKDPEQGEGIGLANLAERYQLLFQKEVTISMTDAFCVEIPLIKELLDTKFKNR